METLHTTGDWYAKDGQIVAQDTGKTLAVIPYYDSEDEQIANANLMAASPQMLKTLTDIMEMIENGEINGEEGVVRGSYTWHVLNSAIQQATNP